MMSKPEREPRGYSYAIVKRVRAADPMHIGVKLGRVCVENDIPVSTVAKELGVSRLTVYAWFEGKFYPKPEMLPKVQALLDRYAQV